MSDFAENFVCESSSIPQGIKKLQFTSFIYVQWDRRSLKILHLVSTDFANLHENVYFIYTDSSTSLVS